jgi:hypothetical protein
VVSPKGLCRPVRNLGTISMRCQQCDHEILPGASYCHSCGWQVQPQCRTCGAFNPSGSLFCSNCGTSVTPSEAAPRAGSSTGVETKAPPRVVTCPRCYGNNEPGSTFCFACGLPLDMRLAQAPECPIEYRRLLWGSLGDSGFGYLPPSLMG